MFEVYGRDNCTFCDQAKELLKDKGLEYKYVDVSNSVEQFKVKMKTEHGITIKTVPQITVDGKYVGGFESLQSFLEKVDG